MEGSTPAQSSVPFYFDIAPTPIRWEQMKATILRLYLQEGKDISDVVTIMRTQHMFYAVEHDYKHYFQLWNARKNVPAKVKDAAIVALGKRSWGRYSTPDVGYKQEDGQIIPIEKKHIKRHIKTVSSKKTKEEAENHLSNNAFMHWNLPYRAARSSSRPEILSPFGPTPDCVYFGSPSNHRMMSSRNATSPNNALTPTMVALRSMKLEERARLFIEAKHDDLLKQMERPERKVLTTYLYQFWLFSFTTAKYWGYGPTDWTANHLEFDRFKDTDRGIHSSPDTPMTNAETPFSSATPRIEDNDLDREQVTDVPPAASRWTIHAAIRTRYEGDEEDQARDQDPEMMTKSDDDEDLPPWPREHRQTFEEKLQYALESGSFSTLNPKDLPMAVSRIARAARSSPRELLQESFAFSLVARNEKVFWDLLRRVRTFNFDGTGVYPLHLLTSFLDGSKTCCNLLDAAMNHLSNSTYIDRIYVNNHGHTVLDNLFISILKGHTSCQPGTVDDKLSNLKRFTGEEVDICGRWDADSPCVMPLHALVLTACHLAESGCAGENLFGMLACLVCLLANGANPLLTAQISLPALMRRDVATECSHEELDPLELAERVPASLISGWTEDATLGWKVFCAALRLARDERRPGLKNFSSKGKEKEDPFQLFMETMDDDQMGEDFDHDSESDFDNRESSMDEDLCSHFKPETDNFYGRSKVIGRLWAAIQTELLTYRRLDEGDPWISENFDLASVLDGLNNGGYLPIKLVEEDMMAPFCRCGRFIDVTDEACACADEVCTHYFANLDIWSRASYIMIPEGENMSWYVW